MIELKELAYISISCFQAMQKLPEWVSFLDLVASKNKPKILEIGMGKGGSSWAFSKLSSLLVAVDLPGGPWGGGPSQDILTYIQHNSTSPFYPIMGNSQDENVFNFVKGFAPFDVIFIDGDHSYNGVKADYERYSPLLSKGGLVAFHDICPHDPSTGCEVEKFWNEGIKAWTRREEFISEPKTWGGIGALCT